MIFDNLHAARLAQSCGGKNDGWTRIIVEKPFGSDEKSAKALDAKLAKLFKEEQIYRIDHYLAKEAFQNVLAFRFFNNLFENQWGAKLIESIHVRQLEAVGIEERGDSYDGVGALRDVGQNHLLQMVALAAMDKPKDMTANAIRAARAAFLAKLRPLPARDMKTKTFRAQYEGYRSVDGVAPDSDTETYFRVAFSAVSPRWRGVIFTMEAGKRVVDPAGGARVTEIEVVFRHPEACLCASLPKKDGGPLHYKNSLVFRQDPKEGITLKFWTKKPGLGMELEERTFEFDVHGGGGHSRASADYEKLLSDCITGDQTLFVSSKEIAAMWRFIDPIIAGWRNGAVPLHPYAPDHSAIVMRAEAAMGGIQKK
jgi:glucose-6-phosphate 1-dehydrogenase